MSAILSQPQPHYTTQTGSFATHSSSRLGRSVGGMAAPTPGLTADDGQTGYRQIWISILINFFFLFPQCMIFSNNNPWYLWNLITFCNCVKMSAYWLVMDCWLQEFTQRLGIHHSLFEWCGEDSESSNIFTFPWLINWPFKNFLELFSKTKFYTWGTEVSFLCLVCLREMAVK